MKSLLFYAVALIIAVWAGVEIARDPSYVLFYVHHWTVEMPLWLLIVLVIIIIGLLHFLWRWSYIVFSPHGRIQIWHRQRHLHKSTSLTGDGLVALTQGYWQKAEKLLLQGVANSRMPLINYLAAARAAQGRQHLQQRDKYLQLAYKKAPREKIAIGLTQAQLQIHSKQFEQALATLKHLQQLSPKHSEVLRLLKTLYQHFNDWNQLLELLPTLQRRKIIDDKSCEQLKIDCYLQQLTAAPSDITKLQSLWKKIPQQLCRMPILLCCYSQRLMQLQKNDQALEMMITILRKNWHEPLLSLFGKVKSTNPEKHLKYAEELLKQHGHNPQMLNIAGKLAARCQLWGLSRDFLIESITKKPTAQAYAQLGLVYQKLADSAQAQQAYRNCADLLEQE